MIRPARKLAAAATMAAVLGVASLGEHWCHPNQVYDLQVATSGTPFSWTALQQSAMEGGEITGNPIFTGAYEQGTENSENCWDLPLAA